MTIAAPCIDARLQFAMEQYMQSHDSRPGSRPAHQTRDGNDAAPSHTGGANDSAELALRIAVGQCIAQHHDGIATLRRCVRAAQAGGVKPEHVVVMIHDAWDRYAHRTGVRADNDAKRLHLTGVALDAYFADE